MNPHPLRYHLRFQILPGRNLPADARALSQFCKKHGVEEVVMFFAGEEWNNGLLSAAEENRWFAAVRDAKAILDGAGLVTSLNPWMTTLHCDRGRTFPKGRRFEAMVSPVAEKSRACASFADPRWQEYLFRLYGRFAQLGFRVLWVEDDFRYHNHGPLTWGGGFEEAVLRRFSAKIGRKVKREEVVRKILRPGHPHPWRAGWMETWREIQLEVAGGLAEAVGASSQGRSKIGLMSSHPASHSIEGRDWHKLFDAFGVNGRVAHRPHFASYRETPGRDKTYSLMMLDLQKSFRPESCEVAPEIENFPFTRWSKSDSQTWSEMALCLFYGSDALLLDLFPFSGNRVDAEPQIGELLDRSRPGLEWIAARFRPEFTAAGVGYPWPCDAAARTHTDRGSAMSELSVEPFGAGNFLLPYGIPVAAGRRAVNAIFGPIAWALEERDLMELLKGGLWLDATAAEILGQRGYGRYLGVKIQGWAGREEATYSVERVASAASGVKPGLLFNHNLPPKVLRLQPVKGATEWTTLLTATGKRFGAAMVAYRNRLGGRVMTLAAPDPAQLPRGYQKQIIAQRALRFLADGGTAMAIVTGGPHLLPLHLRDGRRQQVIVFNGATDAAAPVVEWTGPAPVGLRATLLAPLSKPRALRGRAQGRGRTITWQATQPVPYLGFTVLEFS